MIEWGDVVAPALPADFLEVRMTPGEDDDERFLSIRWVGSRVAGPGRRPAPALAAGPCREAPGRRRPPC